MTIDERLERLTERHEALAQSVEMLTHNMNRLEQKTEVLADAMTKLVELVRSHEHRLEHLEGGAQAQ